MHVTRRYMSIAKASAGSIKEHGMDFELAKSEEPKMRELLAFHEWMTCEIQESFGTESSEFPLHIHVSTQISDEEPEFVLLSHSAYASDQKRPADSPYIIDRSTSYGRIFTSKGRDNLVLDACDIVMQNEAFNFVILAPIGNRPIAWAPPPFGTESIEQFTARVRGVKLPYDQDQIDALLSQDSFRS